MMDGLIEHLLELHRVFYDRDMARRGEIGLLDYLAPLADHNECLQTCLFVAVDNLSNHLLLLVTKLIFDNLEGIF